MSIGAERLEESLMEEELRREEEEEEEEEGEASLEGKLILVID